jgi:two-component system phosphate regulon response regulator PhoB
MLTAKGEEEDKLRGLETGADDYITKPFSVNELVARVKAVLRRIRPMFVDEVLTYKGIVIDLVSHSASRDGETLHLGPTEFNLLAFFMENIGRVFSREQLLNHVWKNDAYVEPRTVDVHIRRLRKAINNDVKEDFIRTVRSAGYCFGS